MTTTTLPSGTGVVSSYAYDNANRLTAISHVKGGTTLASASYTLDNVGNRTQRVDQQGTHTYAYDNLYRLTSVTYPGPTTTSYVFDAFGNRTSKTDAAGTTAYAYDNADRITSVTPPSPASAISYTWDNNGDLTNRGSDTFAWDYEDRMTSATVNSTTTTFAYRGDGLRNSRTTGGVTTTFTWDIAGGLPVVLDDGAKYVYGAGLVSQVSGANTYYYLADGLGSTMKTVDAAGTVVNGYTYDIYGKKTSSTGSQANEFDFAGQQTDQTGLQYLRARYYDPATGTFMSREPMAARPSWGGHPFGYGAGNPARYSDPTGLYPIDGSESGSAQRPMYTRSAHGCGIDYDWQFAGGLDGSGGSVVYDAWALTDDGRVVAGRCAFSGLGGEQCSPTSQPLDFGLLGEYAHEVVVGCQVDPILCASVLGSRASLQLALAAASCTGGLSCAVLWLARGLSFPVNGKLMEPLRQAGREELRRRRVAAGRGS